ncbi:MAG: aryl-sulfate sulfotransferase [Campylobacteraceae bacterium]|nr:aryl-sulfate sulfotransferase [Campylobacteraceae bacterium]
MKKILSSAVVAGLLLTVGATSALAIGGASGPRTDYAVQGVIGEVVMNPYDIAPLTAVIKNGGYSIKDATVRIVPKEGGQEIKYDVANGELGTHGGIPVFGLYPDYVNKVEVSYTKTYKGVEEKVNETYTLYAPPVYGPTSGHASQKGVFFDKIEVVKVDDDFKDRLYFVNNFQNKTGKGTKVVWNNPMGGALEWNYDPQIFIVDTTGEIRWFLDATTIYKLDSAFHAGVMMGFKQNDDGAITWGYGQRYVKYDIMGREIFNRELPAGYVDYSHSMDDSPNGNYFLRVANANLKRNDGKNVRTVRDVIVEVDKDGNVVDDWRLYEMLDPYRDVALKVLDQGAVCLNIDASMGGQTLSEDELAAMDTNDQFGDIVGSGPGRNWAHVNSVDHDAEDDSIILSSRHQNAIIKIGRNKEVTWILGASEGWKEEFQSKLLQPIDAQGNKINCNEKGVCENSDFDFTWTQHTAFKIDELSKGDIIYVSAFDNGDSRGMTQPALPTMKYSRAVVYKIDQKNMTVEQVWEYGKERGFDWYSSVTSLTEYQADKNSVFAYSAVAGMQFDIATGNPTGLPSPHINEFRWGETEPAVEIVMTNAMGYQAWPFSIEKALSK